MMNVKEHFHSLIEQITYLDHELNRDIAGELTEVIGHARGEGLSGDEIFELVQDRVDLLKQRSLLDDNEQLELVEELLHHLPDVLAMDRSRK